MIAALFSGGKDSTLAIHKASENGMKPEVLITMKSYNPDSFMFHKPNVRYTSLQAKAMGIKHVIWDTEGQKELELEDLRNALKSNKVTKLITGAIASRYQKDRIDNICSELGIESIAPLWGMDQEAELTEVSDNFEAIITKVSAYGLDESLLGARIDRGVVDKLIALKKKYRINVAFEGGEAESFVLDAPMFKKKINITSYHITWDGTVGEYIIDGAVLSTK
ncbi:MAG: diphthine--ammonia ligase [Candidatus Marsarchaeota archaeon]|jgi:ABC transporter with metal-binding/Fe-S-binding domain ATP-binding protein|nr:diphthine--ammonia ligase [Candidatus Marsarchaeota archaeon]